MLDILNYFSHYPNNMKLIASTFWLFIASFWVVVFIFYAIGCDMLAWLRGQESPE